MLIEADRPKQLPQILTPNRWLIPLKKSNIATVPSTSNSLKLLFSVNLAVLTIVNHIFLSILHKKARQKEIQFLTKIVGKHHQYSHPEH